MVPQPGVTSGEQGPQGLDHPALPADQLAPLFRGHVEEEGGLPRRPLDAQSHRLGAVDQPPGDGQAAVAWRADHGITDAVGARHPFVAKGWSYLVDSASPSSALVLSEFMADNKRTLNDEDGDSSDWIEIHNSGSDTASLAGWFLTDDPANLTKWCFPEIELVAGGYRVVFASGKDRTNPAAKLHTNFKLSAEGGFLALVDPAGQVVSQFGAAYPRQVTDVSYGWVLGEGHALGYFTNPTPGAPNASSGPGFAPSLKIRPS